MSKSHVATYDVEVYNRDIEDDWPQGKFLVHGYDDVLWTDDIGSAMDFLKDSCQKRLKETSKTPRYKLLINKKIALKYFSETLVGLFVDTTRPISNIIGIDIYVTSENIDRGILLQTF